MENLPFIIIIIICKLNILLLNTPTRTLQKNTAALVHYQTLADDLSLN